MTTKTKRINGKLYAAELLEPLAIVKGGRPPTDTRWHIYCNFPEKRFEKEDILWQPGAVHSSMSIYLPEEAIPPLLALAETVSDDHKTFTLANYGAAFEANGAGQFSHEGGLYFYWYPIPERPKIQKSVHLQRQLQRDSKRGNKLNRKRAKRQNKPVSQLEFSLVETLSTGQKIDYSGVVLSPVAYNVSHSFQSILHETGYSEIDKRPNGHLRTPFQDGLFAAPKENFNRYVIFASRTELAERAGYERGTNGRYATRDIRQIENALDELHNTKHSILYNRGERTAWAEEVAIATYSKITFENLPDSLSGMYDAREVFYKIDLHPIYADGFEGSMVYKVPKELPLMIAQSERKLFKQARRRTNYPIRFIEYLQSLSKNYTIKEETLAEKIGITATLKHRHKKRDFDRIISECVAVAMDVGFLESWELVDGKYHYKKAEM